MTDDDFTIPDFLRRKPGHKTGGHHVRIIAPAPLDPVLVRQQELRAKWAERKKSKRQAALAAHLEKHAGERWAAPKGSKTKMWIRDDKAADAHHAKLEAEFEAECAAAKTEDAA